MKTPEAAIAGMLEAVSTPLSRNDLGRLAQMHSWAQILSETDAPQERPDLNRALRCLASGLVQLLERLILDEAADPVTALALVPDVVHVLDQIHQGQNADADGLLALVNAASGATASVAAGAPSPPPAPPAAPEPKPHKPADVPVAPTATPCMQPPSSATSTAAPATESAGEPYVSEPLMIDMEEREHLEGFLEESAEHMDAIESGLLDIESDLHNTDKLNELFRPFHTIKGIAGFLNLRDINRLTHEIETILDMGRKGELQIVAATVDLVLAAVDILKAQLGAIGRFMANPTNGACPQPDISAIMTRLRRAASDAAGSDNAVVAQAAAAVSTVVSSGANAPRPEAAEMPVAEGEGLSAQVLERAGRPSEGGKTVLDTSIRVDTAKLDALVDAVGELVIAQSMVSLSEGLRDDETLLRNVTQVSKIVRDVQETAMGMRMIPIGGTFQKMRRLVRDVSRKAGKTVELKISGEDTELDKNVIQEISDPLVHLVRNAVDHGIETPIGRQQAAKPETGQVELNAFHQGDCIVIEIRDDGRGLDPDRLLAKAVERGFISPEEQLSEQQVFALILRPGFSTAEQITDISGRGVGLDVVKRNVEQLRGKIEIHSERGKGSVFSIRLPLTLAIIDGMLVRVGRERLVIPTIMIEQSLQPEQRQISSVQRRGQMVQVRSELCPLIQLSALFGHGDPVDPCQNLVVIVQTEGRKIALVVDELIGQQQVVIKALDERFKRLRGISGAAVLGDGRVGLILEPRGLLELHNSVECAAFIPNARAGSAGQEHGAAPVEDGTERPPAEVGSRSDVRAGPRFEDQVLTPV